MPSDVSSFKRKPAVRRRKAVRVSKNVRKYVRTAISAETKRRVETKYHALALGATNSVPTVTLYPLTEVPNGTLDQNRIGDSIYMKSIRLNFDIKKVATDDAVAVRMILFQWNDNNSSYPPTGTQLFQNSGSGDQYISTIRHDALKMGVLRILSDKTITLDNDDPRRIYQHLLYKGFNRKLQYDTGGPSGSGHIYVAFVSDILGTAATVRFYSTLNFTDQ